MKRILFGILMLVACSAYAELDYISIRVDNVTTNPTAAWSSNTASYSVWGKPLQVRITTETDNTNNIDVDIVAVKAVDQFIGTAIVSRAVYDVDDLSGYTNVSIAAKNILLDGWELRVLAGDSSKVGATNEVDVTCWITYDKNSGSFGEFSVGVTNSLTVTVTNLHHKTGYGWVTIVDATDREKIIPSGNYANQVSIHNDGKFVMYAQVNSSTSAFATVVLTTNAIPIQTNTVFTFDGGPITNVFVKTISGVVTNAYIGAY
jgi:hypothetical protein